MMNAYKAYTQTDWNAEKFFVEDENQLDLVIEAENEDEARELFEAYLYETSLYSDEETADWIKKNPLTIVEA